MKQVDIIRPSSINSINGPIGTLKRILKNREYFSSRGFEITLFANESMQKGPFMEVPPQLQNAVRLAPCDFRMKVSTVLRALARSKKWAAKLIHKKSFRNVKTLVDYYLSLNRDSDIVQFHSYLECYYYLKNRKNTKAQTVMFLHTDGIPFKMEMEAVPALQRTAYFKSIKEKFAWTVTQVDRIVFIAKIGQTNFLKYYPNRTIQDTSVIINGLDDLTKEQLIDVSSIKDRAAASPFKYRLCCTGTVSYRKGQRTIIEAVMQLPPEMQSQIHVDFIGDGAERILLEKLVADHGLNANFRFLGNVPNAQVYKYLAENNIYVLMSRNEGLPISIIEAMRMSLPIISTKVSGIPELVKEDYNGFLRDPDTEQLVALLKELPQHDWEQMGKNSRERFEKEFTFERMEQEFCDMYDLTSGK